METKSIDDIKGYHKNPRKITGKMFELLSESLKEYGDLSGILVNVTTDEVIGGNQRTAFFKQEPEKCSVTIVERPAEPTSQGTVAYGYVEYNGEKYNYREVNWDAKKTERANILANKVGGFWDNDILANQFDIEDLRLAGFEDFELGFSNDEIKVDTDDLTKTMDVYLEGNIKQIVLYFGKEQFDDIIPRMERVMQDFGVENHTEAFIKLVEEHERSIS